MWPAGSYEFTITADAAATVAESNEGNNVGAATSRLNIGDTHEHALRAGVRWNVW